MTEAKMFFIAGWLNFLLVLLSIAAANPIGVFFLFAMFGCFGWQKTLEEFAS